jgi:peroxiredoxin
MRQLFHNRWLRACAVAALVAAWPACALDRASREATAEPAKLDFTLKDVNGKDVRLADFKGKPLVINFWATWCGPCKLEVPFFVDLAQKYKAQGLTIVGISTDDTPEDIRAFATEYKINYPLLVGLGHDDVMEAYGAQMLIPVTWFINADGTVSHSEAGIHPREWFDAQIRALFE